MSVRGIVALAGVFLFRPGWAADDAAVALPPFLVEEPSKGPPWRHGRVASFEILARCSESDARQVIQTHDRLQQLLAEILPPALQHAWSLPRALILYDEELQPKASHEVIARMLRERPNLPPIEADIPGSRGLRPTTPERRISFLPNLRLWDRDALVVFMIVRRDGFDPDRLALTHDYVSFLVKSRAPALPMWFVSGFLDFYRQVNFEGTELRAEPMTWFADLSGAAAKKDPSLGIAPLAAFFPGTLAAVAGETTPPAKRWQAQAALLVRWGLEPREPERRAAFFRLVEQAAVTGVSEALFRECFGFDYVAAHRQLVEFLPGATRRTTIFRPAKLARLPAYALPAATEAQIARLKGDWERLQVPYVKALSPELVPKYRDQARRTLRRGHERAAGDPGLLAAMGLLEVEAGNEAEARRLLEEAALAHEARPDAGPLRPRAAYELGRLRLAAALAAPEAAGSIDAGQLAEVLRPLFLARGQAPALPEVYETIADAWAASTAVPTRGHLAVLDEGVRFFGRRVPLIVRAAELYRRHGFTAEAGAFLGLALRTAEVFGPDDATRVRLEALREKLPARETEAERR
jgi:hypothetical protein